MDIFIDRYVQLTKLLSGYSPCRVVPDPIRGGDNVLIMCEVLNPDGTPHETNTRAQLRELLTPHVIEQECLYGFEQV